MGRDSGIELNPHKKINYIDNEWSEQYYSVFIGKYEIPHYMIPLLDISKDGVIELCYWRNVESIPDYIDECMNLHLKDLEDKYHRELSYVDIVQIRDYLIQTLRDPSLFRSRSKSFEEYYPEIAKNIVALSWCLEFLDTQEDPNAFITYYDSF